MVHTHRSSNDAKDFPTKSASFLNRKGGNVGRSRTVGGFDPIPTWDLLFLGRKPVSWEGDHTGCSGGLP